MSGPDVFTLGELLDHHELGLTPLTGSAGLRARRVSGVHNVEIDHPARWLAPDWVMLTIGLRLQGDAEAQRSLIRELDQAGVAALGVARGAVFQDVPRPLLDEARRRDFPVLMIPFDTPFREIIAYVQRSLLSSDVRELQRLASIQRFLVDALHEPEPRVAVVQRLATVLDGSVAVLGPHGGVEHALGDLPDDVADALEHPAGETQLADGWTVLATPVSEGDRMQSRWLVAASRSSGFMTRITRPALQAAAPLIDAIGRLEDAIVTQDRAVRSALLHDLLHPGRSESTALTARAMTFGVHLERPHQVVCFGLGAGAATARGPGLAEAIVQRLALSEVPYLASTDDDGVIVLVPRVDGPVEDALRAFLATDESMVCGLGRVFDGVPLVRDSCADARVARTQAALRGTRWQRYEELDLPTLLVAHVPLERVAPAVHELLAVLDARPAMRETLEAYFAHDLDVTATAQALHLHPNSLRYRLQRLADALGCSLRAPQTIAALHLAFEVERRLKTTARP
jgi:purine catabolism regulator